ncbi:MAG: zinc metallopeptidase [Candidatus Hydrogenedentes bacterium]|nr:zinc metallopeptidase [Candidatus Hydrogenedentota bacterium]
MFWYSSMIILVPALLLTIYAQYKVKSTYAKYSKVAVRSGMRGADVANAVLRDAGVSVSELTPIPGNLTDHYDPRRRALRLSEGVYYGETVAALGVAAHEAGHAIQHSHSYAPLALRNVIYPVASIGTNLGQVLFVLGFIMSWNQMLMNIGIWLFSGAVFFTLLTLPVEFNASRRAMVALANGGYLEPDELKGARAVLSAAALTYVAAAMMAVLQLLRMIMLSRRR